MAFHITAMLMTLNSTSHSTDDLTIAARISACLTDISCWMKDHHLQLNLAKTELLLVPTSIRVPSLHHNITFQLGSLTIAPSKTARNLGAMIDDQLNFSDHVAKTARSCRFALFNIKKIRPFLWERASQLLVRALVLSKLDYYNSLSTINPECVARFLKVQFKFKALMFAYKTTTGSAPLYLNSLCVSWSLHSASEWCIIVHPKEAQNHFHHGRNHHILWGGRVKQWLLNETTILLIIKAKCFFFMLQIHPFFFMLVYVLKNKN